MEHLDFQRATSLLRQLEKQSRAFLATAKEVVQLLDVHKCMVDDRDLQGEQTSSTSWGLKTVLFFAACVDVFFIFVLVTHWIATRRKEKKF